MKSLFSKAARRIFFIVFVILVIFVSFSIYFKPADDLTAIFVDAAQGDSAVVKSRESSVLIDSGTRKNARNIKVALARLGVKTIDAAILSHPDYDHISGMARIIQEYDVKRVVMPEINKKYLSDSTALDELRYAVEYKNIPVKKVKAGDKLSLKDIKCEVLSPDKEYGDSNEDSAVVKLSCKGKSLLFTGDISSVVEKDMISAKRDLRADILKVSHHGSAGATSEEFLKAVKPSFSVVSVSKYNSYNLPSLEAMTRLYSQGGEIFRTDEMGSITFHIRNGEISVESEKS